LKRLVSVLVLICIISLTFVGCGDDKLTSSEESEDSEQSLDIPAIEDETEDENNIEPESQEEFSYPNQIVISTMHTKAIACELAKGDTFRAQLEIWEALGDKVIEPKRPGEIMFYIINPLRSQRIWDAGNIKGEYEFSFVVESSGNYWFYLDDRDIMDCIVLISHNNEAPFYDISIR